MADNTKRFRQPIRKNQTPEKNADAFINGDVDSQQDEVSQEWYEALV